MSFRSSEGAQWRDAEAAKAKKAAFLVLQDNGRYTVSTTGPADAYFGHAGGGRVKIDPAATEHYTNVRLVKVGDRFRAFGAGVIPFTPASLSGLALWLRGDTGLFEDAAGTITATNDTDPIGRWADADDATRYASQATTAAKPTLDLASVGSQDALSFDGGDHLATTTAVLSGATVWEAWGVGRVAAATDGWTLTASRNAGDNSNAFFVYSPSGANYMRGIYNGVLANFTDLVLPAGSAFIARVWFDGTTLRGALNGTTSSVTATPTGSVNALTKYIGALNDGGTASTHTVGHIAEFAAYSQNPASADVGELWDYFAGRYGVTLP